MTLQEISFKFAKNNYKLTTNLGEDGYYSWKLLGIDGKSLSDAHSSSPCVCKSGRVKSNELIFTLLRLMQDTI